MTAPPFTNLSAYVTRVNELVGDSKGGFDVSAFVLEALDRYSERYPAWHTTDIGDDSDVEWALDGSTAPFALFALGYSDAHEVRVEQLSATIPQRPQVFLEEGRDWWIEDRTTAGAPVKALVFEAAPTSADKVRVRWRRKWVVDDEIAPTNEVPAHHQMAVVYRACAYKASALATFYRRTVDPSIDSELFQANETADAYERSARNFLADFDRVLGVGSRGTGVASGRANLHRGRVFSRDIVL